MDRFDYVIVGAGAAGCVLANRLSEDPKVSVCLIEAGGHDRHAFIHMPRGVAKIMRLPSHVYFYMTQPEAQTANRPDIWLRGKVLGGSTSVNGMVWVRGQPGDYAELEAQAGPQWGWDAFAKAYEAIEAHELGPGPTRGGKGPIRISIPPERSALTKAILRAGEAMGWPVKDDVNQPDDGVGIGFMPRTIWRGKRQSAAVAFLKPIRSRHNLTIMTGAVADRVLFEGKRATGVEVVQKGERRTISAAREVILCGGAVATPGILERSGVGDPERLKELGIPLVHANPQIGENVSEHRALRMQWRLRKPLSFNVHYRGWRLIRSVLRYYLRHDGPMSAAAIEMRAAFKSRPDKDRADIQAQIGLYSWDMDGAGGDLEREHGFVAVANPITPKARGSIHIATRDPEALPTIVPNYYSNEEDRAVMLSTARQLRDWAATAPLAELISSETAPGASAESGEAILAAVAAQGSAGMHTVGSCRMGKDAESVVDPELRVRGVDGLRVMDTSVLPYIPAGNTQAPVLAMAWLAAEVIGRGRN